MPLDKYACHTAHMSQCTASVVYIYTMDNYINNIHKRSINNNIYLPYYCNLYASDKYASQFPQILHIPKFLLALSDLWGSMPIYATYEVAPINDVAGIHVHR